MPDGTPPAEGLLAVLVDAVLRLEAGQREILAALARRDAAPADRLVRAVHDVLGGEPFTAGRLIDLATSPLRRALREALEAVARGDLQAPGAGRRIGKFLAANAQHEIDALRLEAMAATRDGREYRVSFATETRARNTWAAQLLRR